MHIVGILVLADNETTYKRQYIISLDRFWSAMVSLALAL
jgi:hypothetical protein